VIVYGRYAIPHVQKRQVRNRATATDLPWMGALQEAWLTL
jgi:hypothetical protein